jgi:hypothetical protein
LLKWSLNVSYGCLDYPKLFWLKSIVWFTGGTNMDLMIKLESLVWSRPIGLLHQCKFFLSSYHGLI